jgi:hypothetical protein
VAQRVFFAQLAQSLVSQQAQVLVQVLALVALPAQRVNLVVVQTAVASDQQEARALLAEPVQLALVHPAQQEQLVQELPAKLALPPAQQELQILLAVLLDQAPLAKADALLPAAWQ